MRAVRALQSADVILIDDLVAPEILDFARREAKKMLVGKTGHGPACKQDEINALMIKLAKAGKRVVRLKGGDPMIFGRAGEEIAACRAAEHSRSRSCPASSAAQGAAARLLRVADASRAGAPAAIRHRPRPRRQAAGRHRLAQRSPTRRATTVVYMPKKTLRELRAQRDRARASIRRRRRSRSRTRRGRMRASSPARSPTSPERLDRPTCTVRCW